MVSRSSEEPNKQLEAMALVNDNPIPQQSGLFMEEGETGEGKIRQFSNLENWRGSVTIFDGFTNTRPSRELNDVNWQKVAAEACPDKPIETVDKRRGEYFVPCLLKKVQLIGKTLEGAKKNGQPTTGKMRSKQHVTEAAFLVLDIDGMTQGAVQSARERLKEDEVTYLIFTTHSHGDPEKTGVRARLITPLNRTVDVEEYRVAWHGFDQLYFSGKLSKSDASGAKLYQQQGVWCCHPGRVSKAKFKRYDAGLADADTLILAGQEALLEPLESPRQVAKSLSESSEKLNEYPEADAEMIAEKCRQVRLFKDEKGADQSEPLWYDCLGVVAQCTDGIKKAHTWSSGHLDYTEQETERKIAYRLKTPPTTCAQFRKTNPDGCDGCTQTCHSPIALGYHSRRNQQRNSTSEDADLLSALQKKYGLINFAGKLFVLELNRESLSLSNRSDGKLLMHRRLNSNFPDADIDAAKIIERFFTDPRTICYNGIEFNPKGETSGYLNLWRGPTIKPCKGSCKRIRSFLFRVICNEDKEAYRYLLRYIAHALQQPEVKPGVMIILLGGQGTGKGTLGRILHRIWEKTYLQSNRIDQITGSFNAVLERSFIVFLDEALFVGDRKSSDSLKSLVTETFIQISEKYQPSRQISSYHRFFAATNADHFKNTERDDRRDFTLRVSEGRKGDHAYWQKLHHEIENGGVEALVYRLLNLDLTGFNIRDKPATAELQEQKLMSLQGFDQWWFDCLQNGYISDRAWPDFITTNDIIEEIEKSHVKLYRKPSAHTIARDMLRVSPSAEKSQKQENYNRSRGYRLRSLATVREEFESYIGNPIDWEGDD